MIESLEPILREHPFLEDLDPKYLVMLAGCAKNVRFRAGEFMHREGEAAEVLFLLREGHVALEIHAPQGGGVRIETLSAGDVLGWSGFLPPYRWRFDARVIEDARVVTLDTHCIRSKCDEDHDLGYEFYKRIAGLVESRLTAVRMQLLDVYGKPKETPRRERL